MITKKRIVLCFVAVLSVLSGMTGCEAPKSPSFISRLSFPFTKDSYGVADLQKEVDQDSVRLIVLSDSVLLDIVQRETVNLGEALDIDPTDDSTECYIENDLKLNEQYIVRAELARLYPQAGSLHGQTAVIPPFTFSGIEQKSRFNFFKETDVFYGRLIFRMYNELPFGFDSVVIGLVDSVTGQTIRRIAFNQVLPGQWSDSVVAEWTTPRTWYPVIYNSVNGASPGSIDPVVVDSTRGLTIAIKQNFTCSRIQGCFPPQRIARWDSVKSESNSVIHEALVEKGRLTVLFENRDLLTQSDIVFVSNDFLDASDQPLRRLITMPGINRHQMQYAIDLDGYKFKPQSSAIGEQYIRYNYELLIPASTDESLTIENGQGVIANATLDTMKLQQLTGLLAEETLTIDERGKDVSIKYVDSIQFKTAYMELTARHRVPFPITVQLQIRGVSATGQYRTTSISGQLKKHDPSQPGETLDTLRATNQDEVAQLLSLVPDSILFSGSAVVGDNQTVGTVYKTDSLAMKVSVRAPMTFRLPVDSTKNIIRPDPVVMDLGEQIEDWIQDNFESMRIKGTISNHFPVPVNVQFCVDTVRRPGITFYDSPAFIYPPVPLNILGGHDHNGDGIVDAARSISINYLLDRSEFQILGSRERKYRGVFIRMLGTEGWVTITSSDFVKFDADLEVEFFFNDDIIK